MKSLVGLVCGTISGLFSTTASSVCYGGGVSWHFFLGVTTFHSSVGLGSAVI